MDSPQAPLRTGGNDAVAFTSGPEGTSFSAGAVHAWLAADRERPKVATGISMGTIAAAAMRRVYEELEHEDGDDLEVKRWRWYQRYYQAITQNPIGPLWDALPNPVDFFSETPPARDPSVPASLSKESEYARRHYYLLTKCGIWLANLPVRLSSVATLAVMYVRRSERYGVRILTWISFYWNLFLSVLGVNFHLVRSPQWIAEGGFLTSRRKTVRPLIGWPMYLFAWFAPLLLAALLALSIWGLYWLLGVCDIPSKLRWPCILAVLFCIFLLLDRWAYNKVTASGKPKAQKPGVAEKRTWYGKLLLKVVADNLDITKGLLHPFEVRRAIYDLFVKGAPDFVLHGPPPDAVKALFVCAALEETDQIILKENMPVVDALTAALAIPGLLPPQAVGRQWIATQTATNPKTFQVIDGASVRTNPLPAFFDWCKRLSDPDLRECLMRKDGVTPSLHVVYNVPTGYDGSIQDAPGMPCPDIVLSAQTAIQLAKRRDTRQEVRQTNNLSRLEWHRRLLIPDSPGVLIIFADEIAPRKQIDLGNDLSPDHDKLRCTVADGCRATLETLYREDIHLLRHGAAKVSCIKLLAHVAPRRAGAMTGCGGLKAVCDTCTGVLEYRPAVSPGAPQEGALQTYGQQAPPTNKQLVNLFPQLAEEKSKVIFLGSGGVFRGAFHIGVMAAMYQTELFPDLVVGASVGTLMGGALCRMTVGDPAKAPEVLSDLTALFSHVDKKVSLTFTLKNATKQLGIRAREIRLSPSELARKVRSGSQSDAGYAATGAPPVLTDALSSLFVIPHISTAAISSQFVAGHFSEAVARFLSEVRRETLASFDIQSCIMGVSLLEAETRRLLAFSASGDELTKVQPYQDNTPSGRKVAFFGTTSFLNSSSSLVLGRDFLTTAPSWSATQQGLCSSAFPAVFAARTEAELMPGAGRMDRYFADGGMFDNLPFFPALEVLSAIQRAVPFASPAEVQARVQSRAASPNLIISAGLNASPVPDVNVQSDTMFAVKDRATSLSYESKTSTFKTSARKSLSILREIGQQNLSALDPRQLEFLNGFVAGAVVDITPTDANHINPTFAFCNSLGMRTQRVQASIGDGCYRSMQQFSKNHHVRERLAQNDKLVEWIAPADRPTSTPANSCPYFKIGPSSFLCPFTQAHAPEAKNVYVVCSTDAAHP
ncbi:patatin-like phospholipase family protein [Granulicella sp. S190]|uniref:patatin-like phospholipase family protein n=1 Tax=Granulicella sp. S190 TaxID=1747226 RepID=UPI00131E489B|nr:patatin-like phospholipase family protein [Granulicella sp. S190]